VSNTVSIVGGAISIANFIHEKLKNRTNTKMRIGRHHLDSLPSQDELQRIIQNELSRLKEEVSDLKKEFD
jgi:hypothetical protein